jgi:hypothetical protein
MSWSSWWSWAREATENLLVLDRLCIADPGTTWRWR